MALVPCRQCAQPFYASCHDASCRDALCPYCEYAEPATSAPPVTAGPPVGDMMGANTVPSLSAASRDSGRAQHLASRSQGRWR